ncbi:serine protease [Thermus scotoductus]|uniref:Serine protease n=1 Tax=Thermus scotoductus TaxID=37636 RepID=A0ABY0AJ86_THESC|nr:serine protease [Thermus scotoductus]RTH33481.1 serine protease [Thermus scotoductus]RTI08235.1 serine protease [Thermus scotoductus]RTI15282.1 serine protease [Thermus scotoductus]RTI22907.1 serine protease [Thermus scotoductus]
MPHPTPSPKPYRIRTVKRLLALCFLLSLALGKTYLIPIQGEIDPALAVFVDQALTRAEREGASGVVLLIDTPGGRVDAAIRISDRILQTPLPTLAVVQNAFSAGALIALSCRQMAMLPGSEIGAALPVVALPLQQPQAADQKIISALKGKFRAVAEARGRPVELAEAMMDPQVEIPGLSAKGEPLTLSADKAVELKVADFKAGSLSEALRQAGYSLETERLEPGPRVQVARFLTSSTVAGLLLALGLLLLLLELFTPGFGVMGTLGLAFLALYFAGGWLAGLSGAFELVLFFLGVALLLAEAFLFPGFGIAGALGVGSILASVYFTFGENALMVIAIAVIALGLGLLVVFRFLPRTRPARALVLESTISEHATGDEVEVGAIGVALTDLRPGGVARFGNKRIDVVANRGFLPKGTTLRVVEVRGPTVVVEALEE